MGDTICWGWGDFGRTRSSWVVLGRVGSCWVVLGRVGSCWVGSGYVGSGWVVGLSGCVVCCVVLGCVVLG